MEGHANFIEFKRKHDEKKESEKPGETQTDYISSEEEEIDDRLGRRFLNLIPGDPRNPDYHRSLLIRNSSNEAIIGALRAAQKESREKQEELFRTTGIKPKSVFPSDDELFTRPKSLGSPHEEYVMAGNGFPTTYFRMKKKSENDNTELDEDLRRKVESLQIGDSKNETENTDPSITKGEKKSYNDWEDELPVHLKSLKFMIGVLNDRHKRPSEFASASLHSIPPPIFGNKFKNVEFLQDTWTDPTFTKPGDCIFPPANPNEIVFAKRPFTRPTAFIPTKSPPNSAGVERRPRIVAAKNVPRRRTRSAEPNISSYRNETPFGTRAYKHRDSDGGFCIGGSSWFNKRRSVELNGGVYVVEEISEEEEDLELERIKRIGSADGSPDSFGTDIVMPLNPTDMISSPLKPIHRLRRDLWNISPISEDFSESDKDMETVVESNEDTSFSSTNATFGDDTMSMSFASRLNCSSPILAHSPSLRKTPVLTVNTPPVAAGGSAPRKIRELARALDDISDKDEDHATATESEPDSDEEETESFEIDLSAGGDASIGQEVLKNSFCRDKSSTSLHQDSLDNNMPTDPLDVPNGNKDIKERDQTTQKDLGISLTTSSEEDQKNTVWEKLSANIQAHIDVGNTAGFIEGSVDQPSPTQEPEYPSYMYYNKPLGPVPRFS